MLTAGLIGVEPNRLKRHHELDVVVALTSRAGIDQATLRGTSKKRWLLVDESNKTHAHGNLKLACEAGYFEEGGNSAPVVVRTGASRHCVVVSADKEHPSFAPTACPRNFKIGASYAHRLIPLSTYAIALVPPRRFYIFPGGIERAEAKHMPFADCVRKMLNMGSQAISGD